MQITSAQNKSINSYNSPSFKKVSIVQIPKRVFANPENTKECSRLFENTLCNATGDKLKGLWGAIVMLFSTKPHKTAFMLENYSYLLSKNAMKKYGNNYSIEWLAQNTGLPVQGPIEEGYHSFYVFTKEHIKSCKEAIINGTKNAFKKTFNDAKEGVRKYPQDKNMAQIYTQAKLGVSIDRGLAQAIGDTPVDKIKLTCLDDVRGIIDKLGVR